MSGLLVLAGFVLVLVLLGVAAATGHSADTRDLRFSLAGVFAAHRNSPQDAP
jgi:hypothetical protein